MDAKTNTHVALIFLSIGASLTFASPAVGAEDPIAKGTLKLKLGKAFAERLESEGVKMTPTSFSIGKGSIDPVAGTGTLALKGRLRFRTEARTLVFRKVNARLGGDGMLKVGGVRMFRLRGSEVVRNGFGAQVKDVNVRLTTKGARKLRRRLRLRSLSSMPAGEVTVSEQPRTVEVTGGGVHLVPDPTVTYGSGTLASKLQSHCVDFINGNGAITPAVKVGTTAPYYDFPVNGGTIGPDADAGSVELSGGLQVQNTNTSYGSCNSSSPPQATLKQTELAYNMGARTISSRVVVTEMLAGSVHGAGDQGVAAGSDLSLSSATISADPAAQRVTVKGIVIRQNKGAALLLNQVFPQRVGYVNGAQDFDGGDLFGVVDLTVTTR